MDLVGLAENAIVALAESERRRPDLARLATPPFNTFNFDTAAAKARESNWENVALAFGISAEATRTALVSLARLQVATTRFVMSQDEELQMLWWLVGQQSWDLDCPFKSLPVASRPLVLGKELAQLTAFAPGPTAVRALLSRAGLADGKRLTLIEAIEAGDQAWLATLVAERTPSPITQPIHFAIRARMENARRDMWVPPWAAATGIEVKHALSPLALGLLFYRERLLLPLPGG
jgi:hypothetical protein